MSLSHPTASPSLEPPAALTRPLLIALAMMAAIAPFATDFYLPAFPQIAAEFAVGPTGVQLCLTAILMGGAVGQLLFGPLSDRFGRQIPLLAGVFVCALASAAAACAHSLQIFAAAQFFQGFGGATGMVLGRAIITDLARDRNHAARATNIVMAVFGIAPVLAPWLGSLLAGPIGWRGILWTLFAFVLLTFAAILIFIRESNPPIRRAEHRAARQLVGQSLRATLLARGYVGNVFIFCAAFAVLMSIISASPFVLQNLMGLSVRQYGMVFAVIALLLSIASGASAHLILKLSPGRQMRLSTPLMFLFSLAMLILLLTGAPVLWILLPMTLAAACVGFTMGNAAAAAVTSVPRAAGVGSALLGALQFATGALAAPLVGLRGTNTAMPLALMMVTCSLLAVIAFHFTWRSEPSK